MKTQHQTSLHTYSDFTKDQVLALLDNKLALCNADVNLPERQKEIVKTYEKVRDQKLHEIPFDNNLTIIRDDIEKFRDLTNPYVEDLTMTFGLSNEERTKYIQGNIQYYCFWSEETRDLLLFFIPKDDIDEFICYIIAKGNWQYRINKNQVLH